MKTRGRASERRTKRIATAESLSNRSFQNQFQIYELLFFDWYTGSSNLDICPTIYEKGNSWLFADLTNVD